MGFSNAKFGRVLRILDMGDFQVFIPQWDCILRWDLEKELRLKGI